MLEIDSAIDGELGLLDVELGQSIQPGQKIGQLNDLSDYKVQAQIDEHNIDRVRQGLTAIFVPMIRKVVAWAFQSSTVGMQELLVVST